MSDDQLYFRQLLSGRDFAAGDPIEKGRYRVLMNDDPTDVDLIPLKEFE